MDAHLNFRSLKKMQKTHSIAHLIPSEFFIAYPEWGDIRIALLAFFSGTLRRAGELTGYFTIVLW